MQHHDCSADASRHCKLMLRSCATLKPWCHLPRILSHRPGSGYSRWLLPPQSQPQIAAQLLPKWDLRCHLRKCNPFKGFCFGVDGCEYLG